MIVIVVYPDRLKELILSDCMLEDISLEEGDFATLKSLDLRSNSLTHVCSNKPSMGVEWPSSVRGISSAAMTTNAPPPSDFAC